MWRSFAGIVVGCIRYHYILEKLIDYPNFGLVLALPPAISRPKVMMESQGLIVSLMKNCMMMANCARCKTNMAVCSGPKIVCLC